jgi:hypothetical protein
MIITANQMEQTVFLPHTPFFLIYFIEFLFIISVV